MKMRALKLIGLSLVCAAAFAHASLAQTTPSPVEGTYSVTAKSAELGEVNFLMILKLDGGKWKADVKDSPTPLTVTNVTVDGTNKITITADAGGTAVTINGKFDNGEIAGDWTAGDIKGTWKGAKKDDSAASAKPAESPAKPAASPAAIAEAMAAMEGTYDARITADGQGELTFTLVIKRSGEKLVTEVPNAGDLNIVGAEIKDGDSVMLSATFQGNPFQLPGKRTGNEMGGKWAAGGFSGEWSAKKK
jgi:hypothetical protein